MATVTFRVTKNRAAVPDLASEGIFICPIKVGKVHITETNWYKNVSPFERLYAHQTLASARKNSCFKPDLSKIPQDDLDFILSSTYDHSLATFIERGDELLQPETIGLPTWRRLKNSKPMPSHVISKPKSDILTSGNPWRRQPTTREMKKKRVTVGHHIVIGGITERRHPMNIKLMNSSHHSPQTIGGYTRQDRDGTMFNY